MKTICIVSVNDHYHKCLLSEIDRIIGYGWEVYVLTETPGFSGVTSEYYPYKMFSYVDKILFTIRTAMRLKSGVLYVDVDRLGTLSHEFLKNGIVSNDFLYMEHWPAGDYLGLEVYGYFEKLWEYFDSIGFRYKRLPTILEQVFYVPNIPELSLVRQDVETLKPILEYISVIHDYPYPGIGNGEGLALSYGIKNNGLRLRQFPECPTKRFRLI